MGFTKRQIGRHFLFSSSVLTGPEGDLPSKLRAKAVAGQGIRMRTAAGPSCWQCMWLTHLTASTVILLLLLGQPVAAKLSGDMSQWNQLFLAFKNSTRIWELHVR